MQRILIISVLLLLAACSGSDAMTFARNCLLDGSAVGSNEWCAELADKPKGDWTANETASYTKHCIM